MSVRDVEEFNNELILQRLENENRIYKKLSENLQKKLDEVLAKAFKYKAVIADIQNIIDSAESFGDEVDIEDIKSVILKANQLSTEHLTKSEG